MTDDLVKQLREYGACGMVFEAADRIEHLENRCANLSVENGILNNRIEKLEAALRALKTMHHEGGIDDLQERDDRTYFIICDALDAE